VINEKKEYVNSSNSTLSNVAKGENTRYKKDEEYSTEEKT